jgi:hypothetical protein
MVNSDLHKFLPQSESEFMYSISFTSNELIFLVLSTFILCVINIYDCRLFYNQMDDAQD